MSLNTLSRIYQKTSLDFDLDFSISGVIPNITDDTVALIVKKHKQNPDDKAVLYVEADVTTKGSDGTAVFAISKDDTDISPGMYNYEIRWLTGDRDYPIREGIMTILKRVFD